MRYYQRHDGTILLADCTVGVQRKRDRRRTSARAAALVAGGLVAAGAVALHVRATEPPCALTRDDMPHANAVMGALPLSPPHAPDVHTQEQPELDNLFPPTDSHAKPARFDLEHARPVMGAAKLVWDAPSPSQPAVHATKQPRTTAGKRAR